MTKWRINMRWSILFCSLLPVLPMGCGSGTPGGALSPVVLERVQLGFSSVAASTETAGEVKAGEWAPVTIYLTAGPTGIKPGECAIVLETFDDDNVSTVSVLPIPPQPRESGFVVQGCVKFGGPTGDLNVSIRTPVEGKKPLDWPEVVKTVPSSPRLLAGERPLCLSLGTEAKGLRQARLGQSDLQGASGKAVPSPVVAAVDDVRLLPTVWFAYFGIDLLVLTTSGDQFLSSLLDDPQHQPRRAALVEWVRRGGRLVVCVGKNQDVLARVEHDPKYADLRDILPAAVTGGERARSLPALADWVSAPTEQPKLPPSLAIARLQPHSVAEVLSKQDDLPLIVQGPAGLGRVVLVGFDLDLEPFTAWDGQTAFWNRLLLMLAPPPRQQPQQSQPSLTFGPGDSTQSELGGRLETNLDNFGEVPVISFGWVALFIVVYILIVGPIDYFFLKKVVGRLELTWITFPVLVLLISALSYYAATAIKGDQLRINKIDVLDVDVHGRQVYGQSWFTVFSPRIHDYTLGLEPAREWAGPSSVERGSVVLSWLSRPQTELHPRTGRRAYQVELDARGLSDVPIRVWSTKAFAGSWRAPLPSQPLIESTLRQTTGDQQHLRGRITSRLPAGLLDPVLFYRGRLFSLETLRPGDSFEVAGLTGSNQALSRWFPHLAETGEATVPFTRRAHESRSPATTLLTTILFYEQDNPNKHLRNTGLQRLDASWRLREGNTGEVIVFGRLDSKHGPADEVTASPLSTSRLWLGRLPDDGPRPALSGTLAQETFVRLYLPVQTTPENERKGERKQ